MNKREKQYCKLVGNIIRTLRITRTSKSLNIFAYENDISSSTLSRIEKGETEPGLINLIKIAYGLGWNLSEFFAILNEQINDASILDE